jgi:hypothetical protein
MNDPFLRAHHIGPHMLSIGGSIGPTVSIRDQMVRGLMVVDRLLETRVLATGDPRPLVVVGGGAGGATAAMRAFNRGIPVVLVERAAKPFVVQSMCVTRWVDPVMYDWPVDHYSKGQVDWPAPPTQTRFPLSWASDFADLLAVDWESRVNRLLPRTCLRYDTDFWNAFASVEDVSLGKDPRLVIELRSRGSPQSDFLPAAALIFAIGFGEERTWAGRDDQRSDARGYPFWRADPLYDSARTPIGEGKPKILVSGSGDGALQDFIRVVAKPETDPTAKRPMHSARNIYDACGIPSDIEHELQSHHEYAQRLLVWGGSKKFEHAVQQELQDVHTRLVDVAYAIPDVQNALEHIVRPKSELPYIWLAHSCTHFTNIYPLNRFVTLLLLRCLRDRYGILNAHLQKFRLRGIDCGHAPGTDAPLDCWNQPHSAYFDDQPFCWQEEKPRVKPHRRKPDILFIRHGIKSLDFVNRITPPLARYLPPFSLPDV